MVGAELSIILSGRGGQEGTENIYALVGKPLHLQIKI